MNNTYIDNAREKKLFPRGVAVKITYDVYAALKAFGVSKDIVSNLRNIFEDLDEAYTTIPAHQGLEHFSAIADKLRGISAEIKDSFDEEAEALDYAADMIAGAKMKEDVNELKIIAKKYGDKGRGSDIVYDLGKLKSLIVELDSSNDKDAVISKIDDFASDMLEEGEEEYAEEIWDAIADIRQLNN